METVHKVKAGQVFHSLSIAETETNRHQSLCVDLWSGYAVLQSFRWEG